MSDNCRSCDPIEKESRDLTSMLDSGRMSQQVADALRQDSYNMSPRDFNRLVNSMQAHERKNYGDDIYQDRAGNVVIDNGRQGFVVATRDFDMQQRAAAERGYPNAGHGHELPPRAAGRDPVTDGVVHGVIGAGVGAVIDGKRGAIAGGAAGIGNVIVDRVGGPNDRDPVTDGVVKGAIGAGIGAIVDGKRGAAAGAAGSIVPNVLDRVINKRQ